jgi:protein-tyrosine phosphatase
LIDLHHHCLPGLDDGPQDLAGAIALCRAAASDGIDTIVATPHVLRDPWTNDRPAEIDHRVLELNDALGGRPRILPGCEYWFGREAAELQAQGASGPLVSLNRSGYLLVEFPPMDVPADARDALYEWMLDKVTPVIAHPERNLAFQRDIGRLEELVELGCLVQVTAMSVTGRFGSACERSCSEFFRRGLVHLVATDAHSLRARPPVLSEARDLVRREWGRDAELGLFEANPAAVLAGERVPYVPDMAPPKRSFLGNSGR